MPEPPFILLYTSDDHVDESKRLEARLSRSGVYFEKRNVSANPGKWNKFPRGSAGRMQTASAQDYR